MITTVTLNPAIDKVVEINDMALGKVHRISKQVMSLGGKSINVARILQGLETETKAVCFLGKNNLDEVKSMAQSQGIPLASIEVDGYTRTNVKVVEPDQGYRTTDLNEQGFAIPKEKLDAMTEMIKKEAASSDAIVLSGSLPKGVEKDYYKFLTNELKNITQVIVDADGEVLNSSMEAGPFMIKPNIHELESAVGKELKSTEDIITVSRELLKEHGMTYILVSLGEDGAILVGESSVLSAKALPVEAVSTVGAGDTMLAGFIYGLSSNGELSVEARMEKALTYGVAAGAIAVSTQDHKGFSATTLVTRAEEVTVTQQ